MRTFAIVNQKGGCGKTTTAINLAAVFAHRGLRTLLVDMDPQSHCATGLGVPEERIEQSVGDALLKADAEDFDPSSVVWEVGGNLDLMPSTVRLAALEAPGGGLHAAPDRDRRLARMLGRLAQRYDRCLIDCPPTIGLLTFNALRAVREALIPVETGYFSLRGADRQWRTIRQLIERIGRPIACHLVPTLYDPESALATDILAALQRQFAGQVVPVVVHEYEAVREAASFGQPVIEYAPESQARDDFEKLSDWLEAHPPRSPVEIEVVRVPGAPGPPAAETPGGSIESSLPGSSSGRAAELAQRVRSLQARMEAAESPVTVEDSPPARPPPIQTPLRPFPPPGPDRAAVGEAPGAAGLSRAAVPVPPAYGFSLTSRGVRFAQPGDGRHTIGVAGDFNRWSARSTPLVYDERVGAHVAVVDIPPGRYTYRLIIDGTWKADPFNQHKQVNEYGELNSVLIVPEPGLQAQEAT